MYFNAKKFSFVTIYLFLFLYFLQLSSHENSLNSYEIAIEQISLPHQSEVQKQPTLSTLEERLKNYITFDPNGENNNVGHILIDDRSTGINQSTWIYVKNALDQYKKTKPRFIILELNTPGGEVFASQMISDALKDMDIQYNIPVVAYINNWAISAGAMLAYSCRFIAIVKDASMGAAEPIHMTSEGKQETASEKVNSALRADFANRAEFFDRNPFLAEAMVDKDIILVLRQGKIVKLDNESQIQTNSENPDEIITPKGKLLTLNSNQMMKYGVADFIVLPTKLEQITPEEREVGRWPAHKMLLFQHPFFKQIPNSIVHSFQMDWKTRFFALLSNPIVSSLLFLGMMIGFYVEINTPGFGIAGTIALTCLLLLVLSSFALQLIGWLEIIMLFVGLGIIIVELFILPTFGFLGIIGILLFIGGLFGMLLPSLNSVSFEYDTQTLNAAGKVFFERLAWLSGTLVLGVIIIAIFGRYLMPKFSLFKRFVLVGEQEASKGYISGELEVNLPPVDSIGKALTPLRPAGKVIINDKIYDVVTLGGFIEANEEIIVDRLEGSRIVVRVRY